MMSCRQLSVFLAMPASIRPLLLVAAGGATRVASRRQISTSCPRRSNKLKYQNVAAFSISEFRTSEPTEITPEQLFESSFLPDAPDTPLDEGLRTLFTKNPATFYYGNQDFYYLKKNTRIPEICILGRSNVGKSSVVNALANRQTNELARVSKRAGKTRSINAYGFGPPPLLPKELTGAQYKGKEDLPKHTFYLVDMPGYGFASLAEWGRNVTLYLTKRIAIKGAILLIDAEAGPKATDWHALNLLATAGLRTAFVITKVDKIKTPDRLRETISKLLSGVRDVEFGLAADSKWSWDRELYVTAVGSHIPEVVNATVTTARLAVAKLAGLVEDTQPKEEKGKKWGGKVVSFEELLYAPGKAASVSTSSESDSHTADIPGTSAVQSPFTANEGRALGHQNNFQGSIRPRIDSFIRDLASHLPTVNPQVRTFHTSSAYYSPASDRRPKSAELVKTVSDFWNELKASENSPRDRARKKKLELESRPSRSKRDREKEIRNREKKRFPKQTERVHVVKENRLVREDRKAQLQEQRARMKQREEEAAAWTTTKQPSKEEMEDKEEEEDDDDDDYVFTLPKKPVAHKKGSGSKGKDKDKGKGKGKGKGVAQKQKKKVEVELDPFEAQFLKKQEPVNEVARKQKPSF